MFEVHVRCSRMQGNGHDAIWYESAGKFATFSGADACHQGLTNKGARAYISENGVAMTAAAISMACFMLED